MGTLFRRGFNHLNKEPGLQDSVKQDGSQMGPHLFETKSNDLDEQ